MTDELPTDPLPVHPIRPGWGEQPNPLQLRAHLSAMTQVSQKIRAAAAARQAVEPELSREEMQERDARRAAARAARDNDVLRIRGELDDHAAAAARAQQDANWQAFADELPGFPRRAALVDSVRWHADIMAMPQTQKALSCLRAGGIVGLIGAVGTGKTSAACALARTLAERYRIRCVFKEAGHYLNEFERATQGYNATHTEEAWIEEQTRRVQVLFLDELDKLPGLLSGGVAATQEWVRLQSIVNARHQAMNRATCLIGNFTWKHKAADGAWINGTWERLVPETIRDRARQGGWMVGFGGASKRGKGAKQP